MTKTPLVQTVPDHRSDEELVSACLTNQDHQAFTVIVLRYQDRLYRFCLRYTNNPSIAQEIVQETLLKAFRSVAQFRQEAKFSTWLFQITKNLCINRFHQEQRESTKQTLSLEATQPDSATPLIQLSDLSPNPQESLLNQELQTKIGQAVAELEEHYREVLVLRDMEDLDYTEIAELLGVPIGTVKSRLHRARTELHKKLAMFLQG